MGWNNIHRFNLANLVLHLFALAFNNAKIDYYVFSSSFITNCILLVVYVDNIVITSSDKEGIQRLKHFLRVEFCTKDLGRLCNFLGREVADSSSSISLS